MGQLIYMGVRLVAGTLYPAYRSFKAVKSKNVKVSGSNVGGHIHHHPMTFKHPVLTDMSHSQMLGKFEYTLPAKF